MTTETSPLLCWACQRGGNCILPPSLAGWSALSRLWAGYHSAARQQGPVWRPDFDALWANPDPLDDGLGQGPAPTRPSYKL
eukprot:614497-Amphidinium_carterae.1